MGASPASALRTNVDRLLQVAVVGEISSPTMPAATYRIGAYGEAEVLAGMGGITYNVRVGDPALSWVADHVEPGVSLTNRDERSDKMGGTARGALTICSCIGNRSTVLSGEARGAHGVVTGKHGGIEHVLVDFEVDVLERLAIGDRVQVRGFGLGLRFEDLPDVRVMNLDPGLLDRIGLEREADVLVVPVTHIVPAVLMGSGLGGNSGYRGDCDIQLFDPDSVEEYGLAGLRLGDLVAVQDADHSFGRIYHRGSVTIGVVAHGSSVLAGHGPGITTIFTSSSGKIRPRLDAAANLADVLERGRTRPAA